MGDNKRKSQIYGASGLNSISAVPSSEIRIQYST